MPDVVDTPVIAPAAPAAPSEPAVRRFEIPVLTELKPAAAEPPVKAPEPTPPVGTEAKPPEVVKDPEAEAAAKARAERLRTNRLFKQNAELKAKYDLAQEELAKVRAPAATVLSGAPDPAKFTDITEYTKAVTEWAKSENTKELSHKQQQEQSARSERELVESWEGHVDKGVAKYDDFESKVGELKPTSAWAIAVMQAENAADVAYYLGSNIAEARRITALPPLAQIREIGKLEAKLLATPPSPKPVSKAPAPISPVSGVSQPDEKITPGMDFEKFRRMRNKQLGRT